MGKVVIQGEQAGAVRQFMDKLENDLRRIEESASLHRRKLAQAWLDSARESRLQEEWHRRGRMAMDEGQTRAAIALQQLQVRAYQRMVAAREQYNKLASVTP